MGPARRGGFGRRAGDGSEGGASGGEDGASEGRGEVCISAPAAFAAVRLVPPPPPLPALYALLRGVCGPRVVRVGMPGDLGAALDGPTGRALTAAARAGVWYVRVAAVEGAPPEYRSVPPPRNVRAAWVCVRRARAPPPLAPRLQHAPGRDHGRHPPDAAGDGRARRRRRQRWTRTRGTHCGGLGGPRERAVAGGTASHRLATRTRCADACPEAGD